MKNRKNILSITILVLLSVLEFLIALQVWQLNIVPLKYFLLMIAAVLLLDLLIARLLLSRIKRKKKPWRRVLGYVLSVLVVVGLFFASQALSKIQETMDAVTQTTGVSAVVELYVLK